MPASPSPLVLLLFFFFSSLMDLHGTKETFKQRTVADWNVVGKGGQQDTSLAPEDCFGKLTGDAQATPPCPQDTLNSCF